MNISRNTLSVVPKPGNNNYCKRQRWDLFYFAKVVEPTAALHGREQVDLLRFYPSKQGLLTPLYHGKRDDEQKSGTVSSEDFGLLT